MSEASRPSVAVVMGSISDYEVMAAGVRVLRDLGVTYEVKIMSAHRSPDVVAEYAHAAPDRGIRLFIAGAGGAAHLAGALAAHSSLPIIGVPLVASPLDGLDALLATVQMPGGVPVATVGIGKSGAVKAAHLAARILALGDESIAATVEANRSGQKEKVAAMQGDLEGRLEADGL